MTTIPSTAIRVPLGPPLQQHVVVDQGDEEPSECGAQRRAFAASHGDAADEDRGDDVEVEAGERVDRGAVELAAWKIPTMPAPIDAETKATIVIVATGTPAARAAARFDPVRIVVRPRRICRATTDTTTRTTLNVHVCVGRPSGRPEPIQLDRVARREVHGGRTGDRPGDPGEQRRGAERRDDRVGTEGDDPALDRADASIVTNVASETRGPTRSRRA